MRFMNSELVKGIVRWDFSTHYSRRGRFREENAFYRIKNGHIFPKISATNNSILPCLKKTVGLSKDSQLASTGIILQWHHNSLLIHLPQWFDGRKENISNTVVAINAPQPTEHSTLSSSQWRRSPDVTGGRHREAASSVSCEISTNRFLDWVRISVHISGNMSPFLMR